MASMTTRINFERRNQTKKTVENVGFMEIKNTSATDAELYIYGDIVSSEWDKWVPEDTCPQDITDFLSKIDNDANLTVYINSCGGDLFAGIGIHNILKRHQGHTTGIVDGIAASIASVILMACDDIVVSTGAQIMIHKPLTWAYGNADDFAAVIEQLNNCQQAITDIYMSKAKAGITAEELEELINAETWMSESEASQCRASDYFNIRVDESAPVAAACTGYVMDRFKNIPKDIKTEKVEDVTARQKKTDEAEEILEDLYMYGI